MDESLRKTLEQLHAEIEAAEFVDEADEALLRELAADIERLLEASERRHVHRDSLIERLGHAIERFEESHPTLTANLARLSGAIGRIAV